MLVSDFSGEHKASTDDELEALLAVRYGPGINEFWLEHEASAHPTIAIMVNGDLACVHYFPNEDHPGFQSVGPPPGLDPHGSTMFGSEPTELLPMPNDSVIPFSAALAIVKEFVKSRKLPRCIEWFEL